MKKTGRVVPDFSTKSLRAFVAVASLGSVARAGPLLGRSDSAVSLQVTSLERDLGHQLFERTGRGLNLTAFGARFLVYAEDILSRIDAARRDAGASDAGGVLRVGVVQDLVPCCVQMVFDAIADAPFRPWIEMTTGTSADLAVALGEERLDLAILARRHEEPGMVMSLPMLWLGSPDLEVRVPLPMVAVTPPCPFLDAARRALDAGGIRNELCFVSANLEAVRLAAAAGAGVLCRTKLAEGPGLVSVGDRLHLPPLPTIGYVIETSRSAGSFAKSVASRLKTDLAVALESFPV